MLGVSGIVPDGVEAVFVTAADGSATRADVHDNGYAFVLPRPRRPEPRYLVWTGADGTPHVQPLPGLPCRRAVRGCARCRRARSRVTPDPWVAGLWLPDLARAVRRRTLGASAAAARLRARAVARVRAASRPRPRPARGRPAPSGAGRSRRRRSRCRRSASCAVGPPPLVLARPAPALRFRGRRRRRPGWRRGRAARAAAARPARAPAPARRGRRRRHRAAARGAGRARRRARPSRAGARSGVAALLGQPVRLARQQAEAGLADERHLAAALAHAGEVDVRRDDGLLVLGQRRRRSCPTGRRCASRPRSAGSRPRRRRGCRRRRSTGTSARRRP